MGLSIDETVERNDLQDLLEIFGCTDSAVSKISRLFFRCICISNGYKLFLSTQWDMMCNTQKGPLCNLWTMQAQTSLRISAGWSGPSLSTYIISGSCTISRQTENARLDCMGAHADLDLHCSQIAWGPFLCIAHHMDYFKTVKIRTKNMLK